IGVPGGETMIEPGQEFQLREQVIGRGLGKDFQTEVLIEKLVLQHHVARRTIQQPGAFEQRAARLRQPGLKQIDIERPQLRECAGDVFAKRRETFQVALVGIGQSEAENRPVVQRSGCHMEKYFLPSRSWWLPFQIATATGVPGGRSGSCMVTAHLPAEYWPCAGNTCPVRLAVSLPVASMMAGPRVESQK